MNAATLPRSIPTLTLDRIEPFVLEENEAFFGDYFSIRINSAYQPIFSLAHRRAIGFEALARPVGADGSPVPPRMVFGETRDDAENTFLDRLCRLVHARNFMAQADDTSWLFLNVDASVTAYGKSHGAFFGQMLERCRIPPYRVVVEILEGKIRDESLLVEAAQYYKEMGCLVAIDDFGAGHSNFERIWRILPHIVKLDRSIVTQAAASRTVRRIVPNLVNLIHEAGSLVLMEGIETEEEALIALDSDIDLVQGYYFARPSRLIPAHRHAIPHLDELCAQYKISSKKISCRHKQELHAYEDAFEVFVKQYKAGSTPAKACSAFLGLPRADRCYVLDRDGRQWGESFISPNASMLSDPRFHPLSDSSDAIWARRHYFRRAIGKPGEIQVSRPYLSIAGGNMCITLSVAIFFGKEMVVLCGDLKWND